MKITKQLFQKKILLSITTEQYNELVIESQKTGLPITELIRQAIEKYQFQKKLELTISSDQHNILVLESLKRCISINDLIKEAIDNIK